MAQARLRLVSSEAAGVASTTTLRRLIEIDKREIRIPDARRLANYQPG